MDSKIIDTKYNSPFQSQGFYDFFNSLQNQKAEFIEIDNKARGLYTFQKEKGVKGFFSKRAIMYGGPLYFSEDNRDIKQFLIHTVDRLKNRVIYIEIRNNFDYSIADKAYQDLGWQYIPYQNVQIQLKNESLDSLLSKMKYNRRREIKMSFNEGANYREANNEDEVRDVYLILRDLYVSRVKLPLPDIQYFLNLFNSKIGKVFIVEHNGGIIGGAFCVYSPTKSIYTLYYCGLRNYNTKIFPTHLAIIATMDFGIKNNLCLLDLMGAGKSGENYGVRKYKMEFGGDLVEHGRYVYIAKPFLYKLGLLGLKLLKRLS